NAALELRHKQSLVDKDFVTLLEARKKLKTLLTQQHLHELQKSRCFFGEHSKKCGRLLVKMLKKRQDNLHIGKIRVNPHWTIKHPREMAETFHKYYSALYDIQETMNPRDNASCLADMNNYGFTHVKKQIPMEARDTLDAEIKLQELNVAIKTSS
ncbi:Hypothetical predicted protein, partial [Pelobates cultripes]